MTINVRASYIVVPFGEKKGKRKPIWKFPSNVLKWMAENYHDDRIATLADEEYQYREKYNTHVNDWD
jgi:hypothetical protein